MSFASAIELLARLVAYTTTLKKNTAAAEGIGPVREMKSYGGSSGSRGPSSFIRDGS
jgi:hypothetical protein